MEPTREQIIHDLAMSCVSGIIQNMVIRQSKEIPDTLTTEEIAREATSAYQDAWNLINDELLGTDD